MSSDNGNNDLTDPNEQNVTINNNEGNNNESNNIIDNDSNNNNISDNNECNTNNDSNDNNDNNDDIKREFQELKKEISEMKKDINEISEIKNSVNEIKSLLTKFINCNIEIKKETGESSISNSNNEPIKNTTTVNITKSSNNSGITETPKTESKENDKNNPIVLLNEQEPIYDKRIKYFAKALNINNIKADITKYKCLMTIPEIKIKDNYKNDKKVEETIKNFKNIINELNESIKNKLNNYFEIYEYFVYLTTEQIDLNNIINMAYNNFNYNPKIIQFFMDRFTLVSNKINEIQNKYQTIRTSLTDSVNNTIKEHESKITNCKFENYISTGEKQNTNNMKNTSYLYTNINNFYQFYDINNAKKINLDVKILLTQLNRIRLLNVCPCAAYLFKKGNSYNNITPLKINNPLQKDTENLLLERYRDQIYDNEFIYNNLSFYLNKNSFYDDTYKIIV
ncbi:hypothetical protein PIROE2DRAFT_10633 [Piromyces sp. E2]|nr:hypothetical protein PIROE2DRAFT_10633 [Piromyces sp. E2]|eukprot:OUM62945.1 hypothetical protein PIROE2DRAFT_10633 [Piromyces sp. E2]